MAFILSYSYLLNIVIRITNIEKILDSGYVEKYHFKKLLLNIWLKYFEYS